MKAHFIGPLLMLGEPNPVVDFRVKVYSSITAKLSMVNGKAFITIVSGGIPWNRLRNRLVSVSDGLNVATGYISSAGTAETLDIELLTNPNFDANVTGWSSDFGTLTWVNSGGQSGGYCRLTRSGATVENCYQGIAVITGALYRQSGYTMQGTQGAENLDLTGQALTGAVVHSFTAALSGSWAQGVLYVTSKFTATRFPALSWSGTTSGATSLLDSCSFKQVLTPDNTGAVIVNAKGGSTQNWASNSGLDTNVATYTITISP